MKMPFKVAIAALAGMGVGLAGHELEGEQAKAPPAFVISNIEVTNPEKYQKYAEAAATVVTAYHGKILTRGGKAAKAPREDGRTADGRRFTQMGNGWDELPFIRVSWHRYFHLSLLTQFYLCGFA